MQAEKGVIGTVHSDEGWRVGSLFTPDFWTAPVAWDVLMAEIKRFDRAVREGIVGMGVDPLSSQSPETVPARPTGGVITVWGWCDHGVAAVLDRPVHRAEPALLPQARDRAAPRGSCPARRQPSATRQ
jgi:hypothetical protein